MIFINVNLQRFTPISYVCLQVEGKQGKKYGISICGGDKYCNGSAVCHEGNGYGSLSNVIFDYSRDDVKLKYSNGSKCNNSKCKSILGYINTSLTCVFILMRLVYMLIKTDSYTSEVRFICNESIGIGAPKLLLVSTLTCEEFLLKTIKIGFLLPHTHTFIRARIRILIRIFFNLN